MSIKRFTVFFVLWVLGCAFVLEPAFIAPLFETSSTLEPGFCRKPRTIGWFGIEHKQQHCGRITGSFQSTLFALLRLACCCLPRNTVEGTLIHPC